MRKPDLSILTEEQRKRLSRDYEKFPLKYGEKVSKEDLKFLYIDLNLRLSEIYRCVGRNPSILCKYLKEYDIVKSQELRNKQHIETCLKHYGVPNQNLAKEVQEKTKKTNLEKYGTEYGCQSEQVKAKYRKTCLEKYGVESTNQVESINQKRCETFLKKYGTTCALSSKEVQEKCKKTCQEKYGKDSYMATDEFKKKSKQTCLNKFGVDNCMKSKDIREKAKQTNIERYGVENVFQSEEIKERIKETNIEKYNSEHFCTSGFYDKEAVNDKRLSTNLKRYGIEHPIRLEVFEEKRKHTCQQRYGVSNVIASDIVQQKRKEHIDEIVNKTYKTKKENGSFGKSQEEDDIYSLLLQKFNIVDIDRQHNTEEYPFPCDFYIKSLNLYIEYQKYWTHGDEPFNKNNVEHKKILEEWAERSNDMTMPKKRRDLYSNAIRTWTIKDPLKRETARKNNLNWIEFFNMKQFMAWYILQEPNKSTETYN